MIKKLSPVLGIVLLIGCTESRIKKYHTLLDPLVGQSKKDEVDRKLGFPVLCKNREGSQHCEYRTAKASNLTIPDSHRQNFTQGIDLSPYEYFDVLLLHYNSFGVLVEWDPLSIAD